MNTNTEQQQTNGQGTYNAPFESYKIFEGSNLPGSFRMTEERAKDLMKSVRGALSNAASIDPIIDTPVLIKTALSFAKSREEELYLMFAFGREEMRLKIEQDQLMEDAFGGLGDLLGALQAYGRPRSRF